MRKPFWRSQTRHWYVKVDGKAVRLTEEPCDKTKTPPPHVQRAWHAVTSKGVPKELRLAEVFDRFLLQPRADPRNNAKWSLDTFIKYIGREFKATKLRPHHLTDFFRANPQWGPGTVRTFANRVIAALGHAVSEGLLDANPITATPGYVRHGHYVKKKGVVAPDLREKLEAAARPAFRAILVALRETGARPGELRAARIERCFLDDGVMYVPNKTSRKTGLKERPIYLTKEMAGLVRERIGDRREGHVFMTERGKTWSYGNLQMRWWKLVGRVPVPDGISLYSYRRSFATTAINEKNVNPALVAQLMGHANLNMLLKHYAQEDPETLRRAVEEITRQGPPPAPPGEKPGP